MDMLAYLDAIGAADKPLAMRDLKPLSDVDPIKRTDFLIGWQAIATERRTIIVQAMVDLAEDNVDLLFHTPLLWILEDPEPAIRIKAIEGLWENEQERVMRRLLQLLRNDPMVEVQAAAAMGLGRFAYMAELGELDDDAAEALQRELLIVLKDTKQAREVRRRVLESAGYFASIDDVITQIERAYSNEDYDLRESALVAMGRSMLPRWIPTIARELESRSPAIRYEAARAAGELGEEARPLVARVARLLGDNDTEVAISAIWALGQIGGEAVRRVLREATKSENEARAQAATDALSEVAMEDGIVGDIRNPHGRSR